MVPWVVGLPGASFGICLREAFQSQTKMETIIQRESLGTDML